MKKRQPNHIICFILTFLLLFMNTQVFAAKVVHVSKVSLNKTSDTLLVGVTDTLKATIAPTNATNKAVKWTSSNATIAKVDANGKVTSLKVGTATITSTTVDRGLKAICKVTVNPIVHVSKVSLNKTSDTLLVGGADTLKATIAPTNATNKAVKWTSSNATIAKVDANGKVTSLKVGTATITATTVDRGLKAICKVTVNPIVHVTKVSLNKTSDTLLVGGADILKVTIAPTNATNKAVKWTSSNATIAKVDANGKVTSLKVGTATITATTVDRGLKAICKVTVNPIVHVTKVSLNKTSDTLLVGGADTLKATILPSNATNKAVKWTSSNTTIAKVDAAGKVTTLKVGTVTITATTVDRTLKATCAVTVNNPIVNVTKVILNKTSDILLIGGAVTLKATILPSNVTNKAVKWTSSNTTIAKVDAAGKVTTLKVGTVTITATTVDRNKTVNCAVTVIDNNTDITSRFTDSGFKTKVYSLIGKASPAPILYSDVKNIKTLDVSWSCISSLNGIEYFTQLTSLDCHDIELTVLDISNNTALTSLNCSENFSLTSLDLSKNIALTSLICSQDYLTALDVSKNTALTELLCDGLINDANPIKVLDLSKNTKLSIFDCAGNPLTTLDVSKNTALTKLGCSSTKLTTLDISKNTALNVLYCDYNDLTTLNISKNTALTNFDCSYNQLTTLYSIKNTWDSDYASYNPQYMNSTRTKTTDSLFITIKK